MNFKIPLAPIWLGIIILNIIWCILFKIFDCHSFWSTKMEIFWPSFYQNNCKNMVFNKLWQSTLKALGPTTSGGFIELNNCLIWCSTQLTNLLEVLLSPLFTELGNCGLDHIVPSAKYFALEVHSMKKKLPAISY